MDRDAALRKIHDVGIIAILRLPRGGDILKVIEALVRGGGEVVEVTMNTPGALAGLKEAASRFGDEVLWGAGTVLDEATAAAAIEAGAQFIVTPTLSPAVIRLCRRLGVAVVPGAFTPTEVLQAWEAGADLVKVFPASVGGADYLRALRGPLPHLRLCPVGGVTLENAADFLAAGAYALGVGGGLVSQQAVEERRFEEITAKMGRFRQVVHEARNQTG